MKNKWILIRLLIVLVLLLGPNTPIPGTPEKEQSQPSSQETEETPRYKGAPGDFIFDNADLKDVVLFFAKVYKLDIVIDPGLQGKVTCRLIDVPWDQALDLFLRQNGYMMVVEGKVSRCVSSGKRKIKNK